MKQNSFMTNQFVKAVWFFLLMLALLLYNNTNGDAQNIQPSHSTSQDTSTPWRFLLEPYFMLGSIKGAVGLGRLPDADVDEEFSDILKNIKFGAMVYFEAYSSRWAITSDMIYLKLGADITPNILINYGELEVKQLSWELAGLRKFLPWLEGGIGLQLNSMKSELSMNIKTPNGPSDRSRSITETWLDPMIIARVKYPTGKKWQLQLRPSIGGFGIGSDLAGQVQGYATYRFSPLFQLSAGYRVISTDYETGSDQDRFVYDINTFGPVISFGFNF